MLGPCTDPHHVLLAALFSYCMVGAAAFAGVSAHIPLIALMQEVAGQTMKAITKTVLSSGGVVRSVAQLEADHTPLPHRTRAHKEYFTSSWCVHLLALCGIPARACRPVGELCCADPVSYTHLTLPTNSRV